MSKQRKVVSARQRFINHIILVERYCHADSTGDDSTARKRNDEEAARYAASIWDAANMMNDNPKTGQDHLTVEDSVNKDLH